MWGTTKRADTLAADAHVTSRVGWPRPRAGPAWGCVEGVVVGLWGAPGGKIPRARLYPNSTTLYGWGPRPFGSAIRPCASACLGGRLGQRSSVFCGVLVRESRATSLAGARWGLFPGLYRRTFGGSTVTLIYTDGNSASPTTGSAAGGRGEECTDVRTYGSAETHVGIRGRANGF